MRRSRVTFAAMEASMMAGTRPSPPMTVSCSYSDGARSAPSSQTFPSPSAGFNFLIPSATALRITTAIPCLSIKSAPGSATQYVSSPVASLSKSCANSTSRFFSLIFFESFRPGKAAKKSNPSGAQTTPTATGPASGPRPASSMPITHLSVIRSILALGTCISTATATAV